MKSARTYKNNVGRTSYTKNVVKSIVTLATEEVEGVCTFNKSPSKKSNVGKNVIVDFSREGIVVDVFVKIKYGYRVPEISYKIQENVKRSVETMTEYNISSVNIFVQSVSFEDAV